MQIVSLKPIDLEKWVDPPANVHLLQSIGEFADDIEQTFVENPDTVGAAQPWQKTRDKFRLRPAESTAWGGANGSWKSMLVSEVMAYRLYCGDRVSMCSLELPARILGHRMVRQVFAAERPSARQISSWADSIGDRLKLFNFQGRLNAKHALALIRYCAVVEKCQHFVLDNLVKVVSVDNERSSEVQDFINDAHRIALETGIHLHIVAHIRKPPDETHIPTRYELRGTGSSVDQLTNCCMVWRNFPKERARESTDEDSGYKAHDPDLVIRVDKQNNGAFLGDIKLWWVPSCFRFQQSGVDFPLPYFGHTA